MSLACSIFILHSHIQSNGVWIKYHEWNLTEELKMACNCWVVHCAICLCVCLKNQFHGSSHRQTKIVSIVWAGRCLLVRVWRGWVVLIENCNYSIESKLNAFKTSCKWCEYTRMLRHIVSYSLLLTHTHTHTYLWTYAHNFWFTNDASCL